MGLAGAALAALPSLGHQVVEATRKLNDLRWGWVGVAALAEAVSMVLFALLYRVLLVAGGVRVGMGRMTAITFAANAVSTSLPGGPAWATMWSFGQLRRHGADRALAGWVVLVGGVLSGFTLFLVMGAGAHLAGGDGPVANLRWLPVALLAFPLAAALVALLARRRRALGRVWARLALRPRLAPLWRQLARLREINPGPGAWAIGGAAALANWLTEGVCLAASVWAVGGDIGWGAVLVVYGVSQIGVSLPLAPGGLGVVEAGMALLLVPYGLAAPTALAAVLLFRVVTLWALLPFGWAAWAGLEIATLRKGRGRQGAPDATWTRPTAPRGRGEAVAVRGS